MGIYNRTDLNSFFENGQFLEKKDFSNLINSVLNKRDDKFHGIWQPGHTYEQGDLVIYGRSFWVAKGNKICAKKNQEPSEENENWELFIIPTDDDDWIFSSNKQVMWANSDVDKIGIGVGEEKGDRPQARLDILAKIGKKRAETEIGRCLLFPELAEQAQFNLLYFPHSDEKSKSCDHGRYLVTGLSTEEVNWCSNAVKGFVFRKGDRDQGDRLVNTSQQEPSGELFNLSPTAGDPLMALRPNHSQVGMLGLNTDNPTGILDIQDPNNGQLVFTTGQKKDSVLKIIDFNYDHEEKSTEKPTKSLAIGVNQQETTLVSNTPSGFAFLHGDDDGNCGQNPNGHDPKLMMLVRHDEESGSQVGISAHDPKAKLDVLDQDNNTQVQILPIQVTQGEQESSSCSTLPSIKISDLKESTYLNTGLGKKVAELRTNSENGFIFRQDHQSDQTASKNKKN